MSLTPSRMVALGTKIPSFALPDVVLGNIVTLDYFKDKKALLVMFLCRHCPYVQHIKHELAKLGRDYVHQGIGMLAVSSNDAKSYPDDAPVRLKSMAEELKFNFPFCYDESQEVARSFSAVCTPDFFLYDQERKLIYRGQLDDSRPENRKSVTGKDLRAALDAVLAGKPVDPSQKASMGCNIKWKREKDPSYGRIL